MIYAPIDQAVAIADGLTRRGHTVDFFAPNGSTLKRANIVTQNLRPLVENSADFRALVEDTEKLMHYVPTLWDRQMSNEMFTRAAKGQYDLLHFHHPETGLACASASSAASIPVAYTLHDPIYPWYKELFELYHSDNQHFISISNNQRRDAPDLPYAATVYNGVDLRMFSFAEEAEDYLLCAGRIVPEKGIKEAIQVAKTTNHRLLIIGPVYPNMQGYFDQYIKPHLSDKILYLGYVERAHMKRYFQKAKAFLTPVQWEEPFGVTTIEAMACGTPVISLHRGAAPEVIKDGRTGFIVNSIAEMCDAVGKISTIKRADCREHVRENFSLAKLVDGYEAAFQQIIDEHKRPALKTVTKRLKQMPEQIKKSIGKKGK
jgi:glycosyltransferase involved in cell wall biosynthesis